MNESIPAARISRHDRQQIELKLEYPSGHKGKEDARYRVDCWIFLPESAGISPDSYGNREFYDDIRSNIRFKGPKITLKGLLAEKNPDSPLHRLRTIAHEHDRGTARPPGEPQLRREAKLLACAVKGHARQVGSLFDERLAASKADGTTLSWVDKTGEAFVRESAEVLAEWRKVWRQFQLQSVSPATQQNLAFVDEALSLLATSATLMLLERIESCTEKNLLHSFHSQAAQLLHSEARHRALEDYRSQHHAPGPDSKDDEDYLDHASLLKKFTASALYLSKELRHTSNYMQDALLSVAAGIAMIWAISVQAIALFAFGFELADGIAPSLVVAFCGMAVIAYIVKDRLKAWTGRALSSRLPSWLHDRSFDLYASETKPPVGRIEETSRFLIESAVPELVVKMRTQSARTALVPLTPHRVLHYRRRVRIHSRRLAELYPRLPGFTDILRLHVGRWVRTFDSSKKPSWYLDEEDELQTLRLPNHYVADLLIRLQCTSGDSVQEAFEKVRVILDRRGIVRVDPVDQW